MRRLEMLEMVYEYSIARCEAAKKKFNLVNEVAEIYKKKHSYSKYIGECNRLCRLHKPSSDKDFLDKYLQYAEEHKDLPIKHRGLTKIELYNDALKYFNEINETLGDKFTTTFEECLDCLVCHIITETYTGYLAEDIAFNRLVNNGFTCEHTTDYYQDSEYGIDFFTYIKGEKYAVQVKPMKFLLSHKQHVKDDRRALAVKYELAYKKYKVKTLYVIHNTEINNGERSCEIMVKDNNEKKFLFTFDELFEVNGIIPKNSTFKEF